MKVLCYINHFFGKNPNFIGKSSFFDTTDKEEIRRKAIKRKQIVEYIIQELKKIDGIEIKICGINGFSLLPIDISFDHIKEKPINLVFESLSHMANHKNEYDYFINIEDDILLPKETFLNVLEFDKDSFINEIFLPNRLEKNKDGEIYCIDLVAIKGFTTQMKKYKNQILKVAINSHSGLIILSKEKFKFTLNQIDKNFREIILGTGMESAFAYYHSSFALFRSQSLDFHHITHLDKWSFSAGEELYQEEYKPTLISRLNASDFFPPVFMFLFRYLIKKIFGEK